MLIRRLLIPVLLFCGILTTMAQQKGPPPPVNAPSFSQMDFLKGPQIPKSNLRMKFVAVSPGTTALDSLSIIPRTFAIFGIPDSAYAIDYVNATLTWKSRPKADSVYIVYRAFPYKLNGIVNRFNYDSVENYFMVRPSSAFLTASQANDNFFNFGNINYNGSFGRGISFGNSQDAVVTSNLNLQISGYLADSIEISAAITDNNIPIQPDGTTAELNEFDKIFLQFRKKTWALSMGDIDLRENRDYYLNFYKRLQGASFETTNKISDGITNKTLVSGAIAKGKFTTNVFQGQEGNQGPYKLQGANNEIYFVVLAGTEKVFVDGALLQRGQDQDYTINYNTAEVTFTPRRMITSDSRIQVEFEYADRNYLNVNLYLSSETDFKDKFKLRVGWYDNSDSRNSPINQTLTDDQRKFLSQLGDSVQNAYYPIATPDTFAAGTIQYKRIDTTYAKANGSITHDSIFVYSTLNASNIAISPIHEKSNGKEKVTTTAKRVNKLVISFDVDNRIAQTGQTDVYVCITGPDGQPVSVPALGSGTFTTREEGDKVFTAKVPVDIEAGKKKSVQFAWKQNSDFKIGSYKIEIYHNGFKIGEGTKELKKGGLFS